MIDNSIKPILPNSAEASASTDLPPAAMAIAGGGGKNQVGSRRASKLADIALKGKVR